MSRKKFIAYLIIIISVLVAFDGIVISMQGLNTLGIFLFFPAFVLIPIGVKILWHVDDSVDIKASPEDVSRYERRFFRYEREEDNYIQIIDGKEIYRNPGDFDKAEDDEEYLMNLLEKEKCRYQEYYNKLKQLKESIFLYGCYVLFGIVLALLIKFFPIQRIMVIPPGVGLLISLWGVIMIIVTIGKIYVEKDSKIQNDLASADKNKTLENMLLESSVRIMKYESRLEKIREKESDNDIDM